MSPRRFATGLDLTGVDQAFLDRFWSKVDQRGPDECWPWIAYRKPEGYGQFTLVKGTYITASRISLALSLGRPLATGEIACHRCDNPPCCNPAHLFVGSVLDNAMDSVNKGRARRAKGESTPSSKLTEEQIREIRAYPDRYGLLAELGRQYGVAANTIRSIRLGQKWSHVA